MQVTRHGAIHAVIERLNQIGGNHDHQFGLRLFVANTAEQRAKHWDIAEHWDPRDGGLLQAAQQSSGGE